MINLNFIGELLKRLGFYQTASGYQKSLGNRECIVVSRSNWDVTYWVKGRQTSNKHHIMFLQSTSDVTILENKLKFNDF